jgi:hypothetical protein
MKASFNAYYDLRFCPATFDFLNFLAVAAVLAHGRRLRVSVNAPAARNIGIESQHSAAHVELKYNNVIIKLLSLCRWVAEFEVVKDSHVIPVDGLDFPTIADLNRLGSDPWYSVFQLLPIQLEQLYSAGQKLPGPAFIPNADLVRGYRETVGPRAVIFHPRASVYNAARNTPRALFEGVADRFQSRGYDCFVVGDVEDEFAGLWSGSRIRGIPGAQFDLERRIAVSAAAHINVCWNGGSMVPLQFCGLRFISFATFNSAGGVVTSRDFFSRKGPIFGRTPSWYLPGQQVLDWSDGAGLSIDYLEQAVSRLL